MHIKRLHEMIEKVTECANSQFAKGIDCVDTEEMEKVACIIKDMCEAEYYAKISKAMDENTAYDTMDMHDYFNYNDDKRFYDNYRYSNGRFAPKGRGSYRPYTEPYRMTPELYRDMDRDWGRMYYTPSTMGNNSNSNSNGNMNGNSSRYESARRNYEESREMHKANTADDKRIKSQELEKWMNEVKNDIMELVADMTPEERTMAKQKLANISNSL